MNRQILNVSAAFAVAMLSAACSGEVNDDLELQEGEIGEFGTVEEALFDSATMDTTAKGALLAAATATLASALDPLYGFQQVEYCGHVIKKANNTYRATIPETDGEIMFCQPNAPVLAPGESRVGFYHTHTPASVPGFSPGDIQASEASGRQYYVISTINGCVRRYNPQTNANTQLACYPGQF